MATIRVTQEFLEYALDLPEGVELAGAGVPIEIDGVCCFVFHTTGSAHGFPAEGSYALQYDTGENSEPVLISAVPVPD